MFPRHPYRVWGVMLGLFELRGTIIAEGLKIVGSVTAEGLAEVEAERSSDEACSDVASRGVRPPHEGRYATGSVTYPPLQTSLTLCLTPSAEGRFARRRDSGTGCGA